MNLHDCDNSFRFRLNVCCLFKMRVDRPAVKINLDEDVSLRGFTPLMCNDQPPVFTRKDVDMVGYWYRRLSRSVCEYVRLIERFSLLIRVCRNWRKFVYEFIGYYFSVRFIYAVSIHPS